MSPDADWSEFHAKMPLRARVTACRFELQSLVQGYRARRRCAVGGKNASLGELYSALGSKGVRVPNAFALTAQAYRDALNEAGSWGELHRLLDRLGRVRF